MPASKFQIERVCEQCGNKFYAKTLYSKYCSKKCINDAYNARRKAAKEEG